MDTRDYLHPLTLIYIPICEKWYTIDGGALTDVLCSVRKEQSATPVQLTLSLCFVLFVRKGSLFERPGH